MHFWRADVMLSIKTIIQKSCQGFFWILSWIFCLNFGVHIFLDYLVNFVIVSVCLRSMIKLGGNLGGSCLPTFMNSHLLVRLKFLTTAPAESLKITKDLC